MAQNAVFRRASWRSNESRASCNGDSNAKMTHSFPLMCKSPSSRCLSRACLGKSSLCFFYSTRIHSNSKRPVCVLCFSQAGSARCLAQPQEEEDDHQRLRRRWPHTLQAAAEHGAEARRRNLQLGGASGRIGRVQALIAAGGAHPGTKEEGGGGRQETSGGGGCWC